MDFWNELIWNGLFLPMLLLSGLVLTLRCRGLQFRRFGLALRMAFGRESRSADGKSISSLQAASTALAATIGTGNIVGTAQAIAMGGPGALFWLWCAALLGMIVKYAEIFLCLRTRQRDTEGRWHGGPMAYIRLALGRGPAAFYAVLALLSALCMGNMAQVNGVVSAVCAAVCPPAAVEFHLRLILGLAMALAAALAAAGGARVTGRATALLVPLMSGAFLLFAGIVILRHAAALPGVFRQILVGAFRPRSILGAGSGLGLRHALEWGLRRGAFSNEAGLGSAALAHASVQTDRPAAHGLWGIFEVFADSLVICTATALAILCSGISVPWSSLPGPELLQQAMATVFGARAAALLLAAALGLFGFTTLLSCTLYGQQCIEYLLGASAAPAYRIFNALCTVLASFLSTAAIWAAADAVNALMALPNLLALLLFSGTVGRETKQFFFFSEKDAKQRR